MPFRRIVGSARFNRLVESILFQAPGKTRPNVSKEFIIQQMIKNGLHKKCEEIGGQKLVKQVAECIQKQLLKRKGYEK